MGSSAFSRTCGRGASRWPRGSGLRAGDPVGRCGNSGNTSEPHLHFHLQTTAELGAGEGLPAQFVAYRVDGRVVRGGEPVRGETVAPAE